jgi:heat shock protein HslJ/uncharacterized lipoprotein YbaY
MKTLPMHRLLLVICVIVAAFALVACRSTIATMTGPAQLTGNVTYSQGPALPADAVVTVQLVDTTMQPAAVNFHGGPAVVGQQIVAVNGNQPPISFNITYSRDGIDQSHTYGLLAAIANGKGTPLFTSDDFVPVLTQGNPDRDVTVNVVPVAGVEQIIASAIEVTATEAISTAGSVAVAEGVTVTAGVTGTEAVTVTEAVSATQPANEAAIAADAGVSGVTWEVISLNGQAPVANTTITAQFGADGALSGSGGCNNYNAQYTIEGSTIKISSPAATMMACPEPVATQETAYFTALSAATTFTVDGGQLTLADASGNALVVYGVTSQDLAGTHWSALMINNGKNAIVGVNLNSKITADFSADGMVSGSGGCNNYNGPYTAANGQVKIGPLAATKKACTDAALSQQESQFFAALASAVSYQIQGQQLEMQNANGEIAVTFESVAP